MSHVRTLNLLNSQSILPQADRQGGEEHAGKDQFTRVLDGLRVEANRSGERTGGARRTGGNRTEESSGRVERDRGEAIDRDASEPRQEPPDAADGEDRWLDDHDRSQSERGGDHDRQTESDRDQAVSPSDHRADHLAESDGPSAVPTDAAQEAASPDTGQAQNTDGPNPGSAEAPSDQTQQTNQRVGPQATVTPGQANATGATHAQQAALLLAQLGQGAAGQSEAGVSMTPGQTTTGTDGSAGLSTEQGTAPSAVGSTGQQAAPATGQATATQTGEPVAPAALQPQPVPLTGGQDSVDGQAARAESAQPATDHVGRTDGAEKSYDQPQSGTDRDAAQSSTSNDRAKSGTGNDQLQARTNDNRSQAGADGRRAQTGTSGEGEGRSGKGRGVQPTPTPPSSRVDPSGAELARAEPKAGRAELPDATNKTTEPSQPTRPVTGYVTRMWTGPGRGEPGVSTTQGGGNDQQNQALASEVTRQVARFVLQPGERAGSPVASEGSTADQAGVPSSGATTSGQPTGSMSTEPASVPAPPTVALPEAGGSAQQAGRNASNPLTESIRDVPGQENIDRIVRVLRAHVGTRESQIRIQLEPPELGRVRIDVRMRNDVLFLNVETDTSAGRELLNSRLGQLREALQQHGIVVERANVQLRDAVADTPQAREQQQQPSQHPNQQSSQEAPGQTGDPSQDADGRDGPDQGDDVPAPPSSAQADGTGEAGSGGRPSSSATESWVDLVA